MMPLIRSSFVAVACLAILAMTGCKDDSPKIEERFVAAYVEMRAIEQAYGAESASARIVRRDILKKYGYTRETYLQMAERIRDDEFCWVPFQARVVDRIDSILDPEGFKKRKEEEAAKAKKKKGDKK